MSWNKKDAEAELARGLRLEKGYVMAVTTSITAHFSYVCGNTNIFFSYTQ
jgi:hypothetical protein